MQEIVGLLEEKEEMIPSHFFGSCLSELYRLIDGWHGVKLSKLSSKSESLSSFKNYFTVAKNWWDQKKKQKYGQLFWCGIFKYIQAFYEVLIAINYISVHRAVCWLIGRWQTQTVFDLLCAQKSCLDVQQQRASIYKVFRCLLLSLSL